jgi:hypothetical protein
MSTIIGLGGPKGSGKSFAADWLVANRGYTRVKFATALKNMLRVLGLTDEHIEGSLKEVPCDLLNGRTPRHAMQTLGAEWGRNLIDDALWVDTWRRRVLATDGPVVVDDVRFDNEAAAVRSLGGIVVLISHSGVSVDEHASERFDYEPDYRVFNAKDETFLPHIDLLAAMMATRNVKKP